LNNLDEILVPATVFLSAVVVIWLVLSYQLKNRRLLLSTVTEILESGQSVDPLLIRTLAQNYQSETKDLRKGVFFIAIAMAIVIFSLSVELRGSFDLMKAVRGLAAFPGMIGVTYLGLFLLYRRSAKS